MPIYLCQPGTSTKEPWRHGVQVYERPFPLYNHRPPPSGPEQILVITAPDRTSIDQKCFALRKYLSDYTCPKEGVLVFCGGSRYGSSSSSESSNKEYPSNRFTEGLVQGGIKALAINMGLEPLRIAANLDEFMEGRVDVLVVDNEDESIIKDVLSIKDKSTQKVHMVVNFDLHFTSTNNDTFQSIYTNRLSYTSNMILTFFNTLEDGHLAKELADVMHNFGQRIPKELKELIPPKLMTPPPPSNRGKHKSGAADAHGHGSHVTAMVSSGSSAGGEETDDAGRGEAAGVAAAARQNTRAVQLRGDSHSPAPPDNHRNNDTDNDDLDEGAGHVLDHRSTRRLQRQFQENHNTTLDSHSSDDDSSHQPNHHSEGERSSVSRKSSSSQQQYANHGREGSSSVGGVNEIRPNPVRRIRHAEVVLVDQCLVSYGRTWLRLRWPGKQGGFGGYVALSRVVDDNKKDNNNGGEDSVDVVGKVKRGYYKVSQEIVGVGDADAREGSEGSEGAEEQEEEAVLCQDVDSGAKPPTMNPSLFCKETNLHYPTSTAMKLLPLYDDGLNNSGVQDDLEGEEATALEYGEPVFCRICREGLHDVNYDLEPPADGEAETPSARAGREREDWNSQYGNPSANLEAEMASRGDGGGVTGSESTMHQGDDNPPLILHHPTAENPLLAPCDCTGTMAFVHYLCIEQWRCRSRHPNARNGLNCETCGAEYTLPPPPARPASRHDLMGGGPGGPGGNLMAEDDWLDAMPPHVLAALRRPHPAWQLGAAVVRRRWLRPVVPILVSPLVALYCRARRTLKKRGVSRRRWACSLCRRRARWKCVRCLRSYYCSRQCQNVSWHIVHKHVCYKPVRFWWSVVVYTLGILMAVPGIIENFPIYDAMVTLLPINFVALGIIFGGIASTLKRSSGIDIRGRILEIIVVALTMMLTCVSSGLVRGYFGDSSQCWGVFAQSSTDESEGPMLKGPLHPSFFNSILIDLPLKQTQLWYLKWDFILSKLGFFSRRFICAPTPDGNTDYATIGCSPSTRNIDPQFYLNPQCSADMALVMGMWFMALCVLSMGSIYRQLRGARRNNVAAGAAHRGRRRPHQD